MLAAGDAVVAACAYAAVFVLEVFVDDSELVQQGLLNTYNVGLFVVQHLKYSILPQVPSVRSVGVFCFF